MTISDTATTNYLEGVSFKETHLHYENIVDDMMDGNVPNILYNLCSDVYLKNNNNDYDGTKFVVNVGKCRVENIFYKMF